MQLAVCSTNYQVNSNAKWHIADITRRSWLIDKSMPVYVKHQCNQPFDYYKAERSRNIRLFHCPCAQPLHQVIWLSFGLWPRAVFGNVKPVATKFVLCSSLVQNRHVTSVLCFRCCCNSTTLQVYLCIRVPKQIHEIFHITGSMCGQSTNQSDWPPRKSTNAH